MNKGILYRIRNVFFPKKYDELVVKIKNKQEHLKVLQVELSKINHLAEYRRPRTTALITDFKD
jgi:hypothetical protein